MPPQMRLQGLLLELRLQPLLRSCSGSAPALLASKFRFPIFDKSRYPFLLILKETSLCS
jgi:hypothetical protein